MRGSIFSHHVEYRIRAGATSLHALIPSLDRALSSSLGDALAARLEAIRDDDEEVVVIREAHVALALSSRECALAEGVATRVGAAAAASVAAMLDAPADEDMVARFEDQTAFAGAFIMDLLAGRAWDQWWFGPFRAYRRVSARDTIAAVLDEHDRAGILRWLRTHGHDDACALLESAHAARQRDEEGWQTNANARGVAALVDAAYRILLALSWRGEISAVRRAANALIARRDVPAWTDVRPITKWIIDLASAVLADGHETSIDGEVDLDRLDALLATELDWLDVRFVRSEIPRMPIRFRRVAAAAPAGEPSRLNDTTSDPLANLFRKLTEQVRSGLVPISAAGGVDAIVTRLLDAARAIDQTGAIDEGRLVAVLRSVARTWWSNVARRQRDDVVGRDAISARADAADDVHDVIARLTPAETIDRSRTQQTAADPHVDALVSALTEMAEDDEADGIWTPAAGLFLLTRPVLDLRLPALARECELPLPPVLALVARALFGLVPPFDPAIAEWFGDVEPSPLEAYDESRVKHLQRTIELTLADQHVLAAGPPDPDVHPVAAYVVRAWARWLPGVQGSSVAYLVRNCLTRSGRVRISRHALDVRLDPAPLDVVLDLAGCFRPIDVVGWLDGRRMTFTLHASR